MSHEQAVVPCLVEMSQGRVKAPAGRVPALHTFTPSSQRIPNNIRRWPKSTYQLRAPETTQ
jgi:hypothetical protein